MSTEAPSGSEGGESPAAQKPDPATPPSATPCAPLKGADPAPTLPPLPDCPSTCDCQSAPPAVTSCFDKLIATQADLLSKADTAKAFKAELEALLKTATGAKLAYTQDLYKGFVDHWTQLDKDIVAVIDVVTCNIKCWWCLIECEVCTLVNQIKTLETELNGDGTLMRDVHSLFDIKYWHDRNVAAKQEQFDRFKAVVTAWSIPATSIKASLDANDKALQTLRLPATDRVDALLALFLKVIPTHFAIAPRGAASLIDKMYLGICPCDTGGPDDCCGPDAGVLSVLARFAGEPLAYIVDPGAYMDIICCLVKIRYVPAHDELAKAKADQAASASEIAAKQADLALRKANILTSAASNIARPVDCTLYKSKDGSDCGCGPAPASAPAPAPTPSPSPTPAPAPVPNQNSPEAS